MLGHPLTDIILSSIILLTAGIVRGAAAIGPALIVVPAFSLYLSVQEALAIVALPVLSASLWQAANRHEFRPSITRFRGMLLGLVVGLPVGALMLRQIPGRVLVLALGVLVVVAAVTDMKRVSPSISPQAERYASPAIGLAAGFIGGFSAFWTPPIYLYLAALRVPKNLFVTTIGISGVLGASALVGSLWCYGPFTKTDLLLSTLAVIPTLLGVAVGDYIRGRIPQRRFQAIVSVGLIVLGLNLIVKSLAGGA